MQRRKERVRPVPMKAKQKSGVDAPQFQSGGHPVNGQHVGGNAVIHMMGFGVAYHFIKCSIHYVIKSFVHFTLAPEKALAILDPFEVADRYSASVAENIRHGEDALGVDDGIRLPSGWAVGAF